MSVAHSVLTCLFIEHGDEGSAQELLHVVLHYHVMCERHGQHRSDAPALDLKCKVLCVYAVQHAAAPAVYTSLAIKTSDSQHHFVLLHKEQAYLSTSARHQQI